MAYENGNVGVEEWNVVVNVVAKMLFSGEKDVILHHPINVR